MDDTKCKNKKCDSQGNYARGCRQYLTKDDCDTHSDNPIYALTTQLTLYKKALKRTIRREHNCGHGMLCTKKGITCGSTECIQLHLDAAEVK